MKELNDALMLIDRHLTKVISNIEQSGGYNIIVDTSKILDGQGTITYAIEDGVLSLLVLPHENKNEIAKPFDMDEAFKAIYEAVLMAPRDKFDGALHHSLNDIGIKTMAPSGHDYAIQWRNEQLQKLGGGSTGYNTLRLLGIWGAKNMNITRKDGLDVIFIPFENDQ